MYYFLSCVFPVNLNVHFQTRNFNHLTVITQLFYRMELCKTPMSRHTEPEFFPEFWKSLLTGVVAFVDVRTGSDNRSKSIATEMEKMGAVVVPHFSKKVTHVVFKDGSKPIYDKAKATGIPIVSYLWVVACKEKGEIVPTQEHNAINTQDYDSPFFKWRKVKSMQPKDLEEELKIVERRLDRRRKKERQSLLLTTPKNEEPSIPYTPVIERKNIIDALIESSPLVQERIHQQLASGKTYDDVFTVNEKEEDDFDTYFDTPLMIKFISKNYYSPRDPTPLSVRKILSDVRQRSTPTAMTPSGPNSSGNFSIRGETSFRKTPTENSINAAISGSPLFPVYTESAKNSNKRKTFSSTSSVAKKRKENDEAVEEKFPRRKLLFQPKLIAQLPQDPVVALTPDESPKKTRMVHPCFSQTGINPKSQVIQRQTCTERVSQEDPRTSPRRDSLADFKVSSVKSRSEQKVTVATLVCTSIHSDLLPIVEKAVEEIKGFKIIDTVDDTTTHVVCGDFRRTLNVMRGVVRGISIISFDWVTDSIAQGHWLKEDDYPVKRFSVAASLYRGKKRRLFQSYESIYVSTRSPIPPRDLCDMIKCAGGDLTNVWKKATLIVGQLKPQADVPCVSGTWVLDCIENGLTLPLNDYLIKS